MPSMKVRNLVLVVALAGCFASACNKCYAESAGDTSRGPSLSREERELILGKIVHECTEKLFWVPSRQQPLQCAGKEVQAFGFFRADNHVAEPVAVDQPFNILVVIPELRSGYKFARVGPGGIVPDGYLGWLATDKSQGSAEPTVEQYWIRVRQSFPEFFSGDAAIDKWEFTAQFPELQHVDFGALDDWKKRELDQIQAAVVQTISANPDGRKEVSLTIGEFSRWSGYVYVVVPELNTLLTVPFALSPLGSEYPVEADSAKRTRLDNANPDLIQRIREHGFKRKVPISH